MRLLDEARWREIEPQLDRALDLEGEARAAFLAELRREEPEAADLLDELLRVHERAMASRFLEELPEVEDQPSLAGQNLGPYTLVALLGSGGMGAVWRARRSDGRFAGDVAVKLLHPSLLDGQGEARFRREGTILSRLTHPGIARLYDAGISPSGQPYLVLELVEGTPLDRFCDARGLDVRARLELFLQVIDTVAHAHASLVVHRDLKPSNILVDRDGGVKLLDFGVATLVDEASGAAIAWTRTGGGALTPGYAAPEQIEGSSTTVATDVYALGVLLYELLTGRHPFLKEAATPADARRALATGEPARMSERVARSPAGAAETRDSLATRGTTRDRLVRALAGDLDTIVAHALKHEPGERYPTAAALADDLRRYLEHQPIRARPDSLGYRARKFVRRHRLPVALGAAAVAVAAAGVAGTLVQAARARAHATTALAQRDFALRELARAEAINDLNAFLLHDAAPQREALSVGELLARAGEVVERQSDDPDETRVAMLVEIGRLYGLRDDEIRAREFFERAWELARGSSDPGSRARAGCALAGALAHDGEGERADALFQEVEVFLPHEAQFDLLRVECDLLRSELGDMLGNVREVERAQRRLAASGFRSSAMELAVAIRLADAYRLADRHREADVAFERAFARLTALGRDRSQTAATLLNDWALTARGRGQPLRSERLFRQAIEIEGGRAGESEAKPALLNNLSRTLLDLGRLEEAESFAERARDGAARSGDNTTTIQSLLQLTILARLRGDLGTAGLRLAELDAAMRRLLGDDNIRFSQLTMESAALAAARGETERALAEADRAIDLAQAGAAQQPQYLRRLLPRRSELRLAAGRAEAALADAERAVELELRRTEPGDRSSLLGSAHLARARALDALGRAEAARAAYRAAAEQFEPTLGAENPDLLEARRRADAPAG